MEVASRNPLAWHVNFRKAKRRAGFGIRIEINVPNPFRSDPFSCFFSSPLATCSPLAPLTGPALLDIYSLS